MDALNYGLLFVKQMKFLKYTIFARNMPGVGDKVPALNGK